MLYEGRSSLVSRNRRRVVAIIVVVYENSDAAQ